MEPFERLSARLGLTRSEITVVSLLAALLLIGSVLQRLQAVEEREVVEKRAEAALFSEAELDSLIALAAIQQEQVHEQVAAAVSQERSNTPKNGNRRLSGPIAFNSADSRELQLIPGIGPVIAERLVTFRNNAGGRIESIDRLLEVKGIGRKKLETLKKHLTLD